MSEEMEMDEIRRIIEDLQARLVELFDQFRELRIRLDQKPLDFSPPSTAPFSTAPKKPLTESIITDSKKEGTVQEPSSIAFSAGVADLNVPSDVRVSRLLDPITHELNTGSSPAEIIAEYLQAAKDELIPREAQHNKVAQDMDVVLKFLRARGRRSVRAEERDNILRRINRWKAHLSK